MSDCFFDKLVVLVGALLMGYFWGRDRMFLGIRFGKRDRSG